MDEKLKLTGPGRVLDRAVKKGRVSMAIDSGITAAGLRMIEEGRTQ